MNEHIIKVLNNKYTVPAVVGVTAFVSGATGGYILGKRRGDVFVINESDILDGEPTEGDTADDGISNWKDYVDVVMNDPETTVTFGSFSPTEDLEDISWETEDDAELDLEEDELEEAIQHELWLESQQEPEEVIVPEVQNVFAADDDQWVYEDELSIRTGDAPYVIHVDEYKSNETEYDQRTITYYSGDDIMADESDTPIYDFNSMMGDLKFGHGSGDKSVVYIRNEKLEMEWEVILHTGHFEIEVLGHDIEALYANQDAKRAIRSFRDDD